MADNGLDTCSFCSKHKDSVQKLIVGDRVAICNECVELCRDLLEEPKADPITNHLYKDPRLVKNFLDEYVIGQETAKITLAVSIVNHYKKLNRIHAHDFSKSNILMIGPTGSGKTHLARSVAQMLDVPFVIADATSVTEAGYVGDDVESLISRLFVASGNDIEKTQRGIVFIDEIDKISRKSESTSVTRDVSGEGVQQALLKMVEGTKCRIPVTGNRKHPAGDMVEIDTAHILFIGGGAFVGLESILATRIQGTSMGFTTEIKPKEGLDLSQLIPDDLVKFGMIPEFVGRFPSVVTLTELTDQELRRILTDVKNSLLSQYQWLFECDGVSLQFSDAGIDAIVARAKDSGTGARGLHSELEKILIPHMYELVGYSERDISKLVIDADQVNKPSTL